jgi:hypothetical protein
MEALDVHSLIELTGYTVETLVGKIFGVIALLPMEVLDHLPPQFFIPLRSLLLARSEPVQERLPLNRP